MSEETKISQLAQMDDKDPVKRPIRATVRQAMPRKEEPNNYKPGETRFSQKVQLSDETGTCWAWANECQELHNGDAVILQAVNGTRGWTGAIVRKKDGYAPELSFYPKGLKLVGVSQRPEYPDPEWVSPQPRQQQQATPPARQASLPLAPARRTSREMEHWLSAVTERIFVNLSDGLCSGCSNESKLAASQAMAVSLAIACGRGEIDYVAEAPLPKPAPERAPFQAPEPDPTDPGPDWGEFGEEVS